MPAKAGRSVWLLTSPRPQATEGGQPAPLCPGTDPSLFAEWAEVRGLPCLPVGRLLGVHSDRHWGAPPGLLHRVLRPQLGPQGSPPRRGCQGPGLAPHLRASLSLRGARRDAPGGASLGKTRPDLLYDQNAPKAGRQGHGTLAGRTCPHPRPAAGVCGALGTRSPGRTFAPSHPRGLPTGLLVGLGVCSPSRRPHQRGSPPPRPGDHRFVGPWGPWHRAGKWPGRVCVGPSVLAAGVGPGLGPWVPGPRGCSSPASPRGLLSPRSVTRALSRRDEAPSRGTSPTSRGPRSQPEPRVGAAESGACRVSGSLLFPCRRPSPPPSPP